MKSLEIFVNMIYRSVTMTEFVVCTSAYCSEFPLQSMFYGVSNIRTFSKVRSNSTGERTTRAVGVFGAKPWVAVHYFRRIVVEKIVVYKCIFRVEMSAFQKYGSAAIFIQNSFCSLFHITFLANDYTSECFRFRNVGSSNRCERSKALFQYFY